MKKLRIVSHVSCWFAAICLMHLVPGGIQAADFTNIPPAHALSTPSASTNLYTRTFRLATNGLAEKLATITTSSETNLNSMLRAFFTKGIGLDLQLPKAFFYSERQGTLFVRVTLADLKLIDQAVEILHTPPPLVNIRAKFVAVPEEQISKLLDGITLTNNPGKGAFIGRLTEPQARQLFKRLGIAKGVHVLATPEVTTVSGRQAQVEFMASVTNKDFGPGQRTAVTNRTNTNIAVIAPMPHGLVLDLIPYVSADGSFVQVVASPTMTEPVNLSDPKAYSYSGSLLLVPTRHAKLATTTTTVRSRETVVTGGFNTETMTRHPDGSKTQQPDLQTQKNQLLVFITPTIVDDGGHRVHTEEQMPFSRERVPTQPSGK
jgi:hypothetical protein